MKIISYKEKYLDNGQIMLMQFPTPINRRTANILNVCHLWFEPKQVVKVI